MEEIGCFYDVLYHHSQTNKKNNVTSTPCFASSILVSLPLYFIHENKIKSLKNEKSIILCSIENHDTRVHKGRTISFCKCTTFNTIEIV